MGADIHVVVEYDEGAEFLRPWGFALVRWPRQTDLFIAISGLWGHPSLIPARGFPNPASLLAYREYGLQVVDSDDVDAMLTFPSVLKEEVFEGKDPGDIRYLPHMDGFIANPAWCFPSWLTKDEFLECVKHSKIERLSIEADTTVAMMEFIESRGYITRMVFWFDD